MLLRVKPPPCASQRDNAHEHSRLQTTSSFKTNDAYCITLRTPLFEIVVSILARQVAPSSPLAHVPNFQLIQTFQESSGAICHGQSPAEFNAGSLAHFRLYFRLSHNNDWWWWWSPGEKSLPCRIDSEQSSWLGRGSFSAPGRTFPNMGNATSFARALQTFPEETMVPNVWSEDPVEVPDKVQQLHGNKRS